MNQIIMPSTLAGRVRELATEISETMSKSVRLLSPGDIDPVIVIGILSGGAIFTADLIRLLDTPTVLAWATAQSYKGIKKELLGPPRVDLIVDWNSGFTDRRILIVDDIVETRLTMLAVVEHVARFDPRSIQTVALLRKPCFDPQIEVDYVGFDVSNDFVVGYGLDYDGLYRDLPGIWVL